MSEHSGREERRTRGNLFHDQVGRDFDQNVKQVVDGENGDILTRGEAQVTLKTQDTSVTNRGTILRNRGEIDESADQDEEEKNKLRGKAEQVGTHQKGEEEEDEQSGQNNQVYGRKNRSAELRYGPR